jgi:hypothetical protein
MQIQEIKSGVPLVCIVCRRSVLVVADITFYYWHRCAEVRRIIYERMKLAILPLRVYIGRQVGQQLCVHFSAQKFFTQKFLIHTYQYGIYTQLLYQLYHSPCILLP